MQTDTLPVIAAALVLAVGVSAASAANNRGDAMTLHTRTWSPQAGREASRETTVTWSAKQTAVIVCDMWDKHWCKGATRRVAEMAPRMNEFLVAARQRGALIVHAPSSCMKAYANHPARKRAQAAPKAKDLPKDIGGWNRGLPSEKGAVWPIDQSNGGCDCTPRCKTRQAWTRQIGTIEIDDADAISDSGVEIWNVLAQRGIQNVMLLGVHTNMCVIGRPFGLRNMVAGGKNVVLVRDLTDTMYDSRSAPHVSHFCGTNLIVRYIEQHVCPTILSTDLTGKPAFAFKNADAGHVLLLIAEREYKTNETLPVFAARVLTGKLGMTYEILEADPKDRNVIPGLADAVGRADLILLSVRRRCLPAKDLAAVRAYLAAGKPLVGIRTASHAFDTKGKHPKGHAEWRDFDPVVLGGNYHGHYGAGPTNTVTAAKGARKHPILAGVKLPILSKGSLYKNTPLAKTATCVLIGTIPGQAPEPVAWTHEYKGGRIFYTSLGHTSDFAQDGFYRLLENAVRWATGMNADERG